MRGRAVAPGELGMVMRTATCVRLVVYGGAAVGVRCAAALQLFREQESAPISTPLPDVKHCRPESIGRLVR